MATSTEAQMMRQQLRQKIEAYQEFELRFLGQVCDADLAWDLREQAYTGLIACENAVLDLEGSLNQVNEALRGA